MVISLAKVVISEVEEVEGPKGSYKKLLVYPERTGNKYCPVSLLRIPPGP